MSEPAGGGGEGRKTGTTVSRTGGGRRRRKRNKVRAAPFPTRTHHQQHQSARPGEQNRESAAGKGSPGSGEHRPLRKEVLKAKVVKSEKKSKQSDKNLSAQRCEQRSLHKPKGKCSFSHTKMNSPKKLDKIQAEPDLANLSFQRTGKKPLASAENVRNLKQNTHFIPPTDQTEKEINYAGAKFSDPPSPSLLPKPPSHWMGVKGEQPDQCKELMTYQLKTLLKVQL
uniref:Proline rich nuclear receptor coactivator 1 n=1 Tax=Leptobrachium leishanense TaxID=445787 RepID=A0A8C5WF18_9ANUR